MASSIPHINLLVLESEYSEAFEKALEDRGIKNKISYSVYESPLANLDPSVKSDLVVSPANSYALMDGGFDHAISRCFSAKDEYGALLRHCQRKLYKLYRGFQPPGSAVIIDIPRELLVEGRTRNVWGIKYIGHCPTMRVPSDCRWDVEVAYECIWTLLCQIDNHNQEVRGREQSSNSSGGGGGAAAAAVEESPDHQTAIRSILMTPIATGVGNVSAEKWAQQAALALSHFIAASEQPEEWSRMNWPEAEDLALEVRDTHGL